MATDVLTVGDIEHIHLAQVRKPVRPFIHGLKRATLLVNQYAAPHRSHRAQPPVCRMQLP